MDMLQVGKGKYDERDVMETTVYRDECPYFKIKIRYKSNL